MVCATPLIHALGGGDLDWAVLTEPNRIWVSVGTTRVQSAGKGHKWVAKSAEQNGQPATVPDIVDQIGPMQWCTTCWVAKGKNCAIFLQLNTHTRRRKSRCPRCARNPTFRPKSARSAAYPLRGARSGSAIGRMSPTVPTAAAPLANLAKQRLAHDPPPALYLWRPVDT